MRLIDADALEELFRETISGIAKEPKISGSLEHMMRASAMTVQMIQDAPTIEPQKWIPICKELPDEETWVNVLCVNPLHDTLFVSIGNYSMLGDSLHEQDHQFLPRIWNVLNLDTEQVEECPNVVAWMLLPQS